MELSVTIQERYDDPGEAVPIDQVTPSPGGTTMAPARADGGAAAVAEHWIAWRGQAFALVPGTTITFGRSGSSDLQLTRDDLQVSGHAGAVVAYLDHLEVLNRSDSRPLTVRPPVGEEVVVRPRLGWTSRGVPAFDIVLTGSYGTEYVCSVRTRGAQAAADVRTGSAAPTVSQPFPLTGTESAILVALCGPMLRGAGAGAVPATYATIGRLVGRSPGYVRNVVGRLRMRLTEEGVAGFDAADESGALDFRLPLARYAIDNGWAFGEVQG